MFKSSYACTDGLSYAVIVALICTGKETHTHNSPSIGIKTFWECRCEEVVPHPSSGFTYLLFKAVLCCVIVQTHSHFVKCVKRQRGQGLSTTLGWSIHPFLSCAFVRTTLTCCGSGQLSACPRTAKRHFTFSALMTEMEYAWILSSSKSEKKERNAVLGCLMHMQLPSKKNVAQLQFYHISSA